MLAFDNTRPSVGEEIDHGFFLVTAHQAREICGGQLPKHGYELRGTVDGREVWVQRTPYQGRQRWAFHGWWKF